MGWKLKLDPTTSAELETVFRGSAACKPEITDQTEFSPHTTESALIGHTAPLLLPWHFVVLVWPTRYRRLCHRSAVRYRLLATAGSHGSHP